MASIAPSTSFALLLAVLLSLSMPARAEDDLPAPDSRDSHAAHAAALLASDRATFEGLLARYDDAEKSDPNHVVLAVERCRFLSSIAILSDVDPYGVTPLLAICENSLRVRFSHSPTAWVFVAERHFGEQRLMLLREAFSMGPRLKEGADGARLEFMLAEQLDRKGEHEQAREAALSAWQGDPNLDVSLIVARAAQARGDRVMAVEWLERGLEHTQPAYDLLAKARLLTDLKAFRAAERALGLHEAQFPGMVDELLRARILEGLGKVAEAREIYRKLPPSSLLTGEARKRRFELELTRGNAAQASTAYEALRDTGFHSDPVLRQRLRLVWAHPSAPFRLRDLWGLATLIGVLCGMASVPFVLLLPVHYVGLILRAASNAPAAPTFTLWNAAKLFGLVLATQTLASYLIAADSIEAWFQKEALWAPAPALPEAVQAKLLVLGMGTTLVVILSYLRLPELKRAFAWGSSKPLEGPSMAQRVMRYVGVVFLIALANGFAIKVLGIDLLPKGTAVAPVTTQSMLHALLSNYGPYPVIMVAVIFAPITEELLFRHVLTDALEDQLPQAWANRGQALVFALCHDQWFMWPTLFSIGLLAGKLRKQTGDLTSSFLLHASWNLLVLCAMLAQT